MKKTKKKSSAVEKRAALIIQYRKMKVKKKERNGDLITYYLSKGGKKYILQCITNQRTVGIAFVRSIKDLIKETDSEGGILIADVKYTYSARANAPKLGVELVPPSLPTFDIFKHKLVPKADVLSKEELESVLEAYHAKPFQFPWIKVKDPVSIILGARTGDIIKFTRESEITGTSVSYRYVV